MTFYSFCTLVPDVLGVAAGEVPVALVVEEAAALNEPSEAVPSGGSIALFSTSSFLTKNYISASTLPSASNFPAFILNSDR